MKTLLHGVLVAALLTVGAPAFATMNYNELGFDLLAGLRQSNPQHNIFISPVGLGFCLSMAASGAAGNTAQEMRGVMHVAPQANLDGENRALLDHLLKHESTYKLEIANSLWTANDAEIKPAFLDAMRHSYQAESASVDFRNPATANRINKWVSGKTHGKIPKFVDPPLDANRLILLDAIYFKGDWATPFNKKLTQDQTFTLLSGQAIKHPRMARSDKFAYFEDDAFQAVMLPYTGSSVSMYVFLPKKSLDDLWPKLTAANWEHWITQFDSRQGTLELPRFKLDNEYDLKSPLVAMGMRQAFGVGADFSGISSERLYIDWIRQKTYVDVNEEGTEAAAVTGIGMRAMAVRIEPAPFKMVVDRPFFVAIRDNQSGALLFMGAIMDPR